MFCFSFFFVVVVFLFPYQLNWARGRGNYRLPNNNNNLKLCNGTTTVKIYCLLFFLYKEKDYDLATRGSTMFVYFLLLFGGFWEVMNVFWRNIPYGWQDTDQKQKKCGQEDTGVGWTIKTYIIKIDVFLKRFVYLHVYKEMCVLLLLCVCTCRLVCVVFYMYICVL